MMGAMDANFIQKYRSDPSVVESSGGVPALSANNVTDHQNRWLAFTTCSGTAGNSIITVLLSDCSEELQLPTTRSLG